MIMIVFVSDQKFVSCLPETIFTRTAQQLVVGFDRIIKHKKHLVHLSFSIWSPFSPKRNRGNLALPSLARAFIAGTRYFFLGDKNFIVTGYGPTSRSSITHSSRGMFQPQRITRLPIKAADSGCRDVFQTVSQHLTLNSKIAHKNRSC